MDMTECPYKNTSDLENLALVSDMFTNPIVRQDVRNMNRAYLQDRIPNCVALAVYSCLRFSGIVQHITGEQVANAFRVIGEKSMEGFSDLDIHLLIEALTNHEYTASLVDHADYQSNRLDIEKRISMTMIAEVTLHGTKDTHVYAVLRLPEAKYHIFDDSLKERILGDAIGNYIGTHRTKSVICIHKKDVKLNDICQTFS